MRGLVNLHSLSSDRTTRGQEKDKSIRGTAFTRIKDKWFGKGSPSFWKWRSLRGNVFTPKPEPRKSKKKKREERLAGREAEDPLPPNCDRSKDEMEEDSTEEKKKRKNHETDRWDDKIVHRSLNGEKGRIEKMLLGRISKAYNFLPSFPALRR